MVDIHTHILPGIDDGASDFYDMIEMARVAVESGTTDLVATPHCNLSDLYDNYYGEDFERYFLQCQQTLRQEEIPLNLMPGMEVYATEQVPDLIRQGKIIPINRRRYILIEFDFDEMPDFAGFILPRIRDTGLVPVIAHVERYRFVQEWPGIIYDWKRRGYEIQVNKSSFTGSFGENARMVAYECLNRNLITAIASDAHSPLWRTPSMKEVYKMLSESYDTDYLDILFTENPQRICAGKSLVRFRYIPFDDDIMEDE